MWHPSKNGALQPDHVKHASNRQVWQQCDSCSTCGEVHEWSSQAGKLAKCGGNIVCPFCESRVGRICGCRSDAADKRLAAEWHEDKTLLKQLAVFSNEGYLWRCPEPSCQHVWEAMPNDRSARGQNCSEWFSRAVRKVRQGSLVAVRPDLAAEWDEELN